MIEDFFTLCGFFLIAGVGYMCRVIQEHTKKMKKRR